VSAGSVVPRNKKNNASWILRKAVRSIHGYTADVLFTARRAAARLGDHAGKPWPLSIRLASKDKRLVKLAQDWNLLHWLDTKPGLQEANHVVKITERYMHAPEGKRVKKS
jgi:hypothetical protein